MLKKQTVWLLTMLSLVVVLSVYYVTAPKNMNNSPAFTANQKTEKTTDQPSVAVEEAKSRRRLAKRATTCLQRCA
ncbi:Stage III sporulation protein AH [Geobacillus sp. BCO2]|nr:Stage III sporulation protein AH [Geobacillus sp. BCO2]